MQATEIPRFNFIEWQKDQNAGPKEHFYFVTTDVNEAVDHYLHRLREHHPFYMTISSVDGRICFARANGLSSDKTKPRMIHMNPDLNQKIDDDTWFTHQFMKTIERKLSLIRPVAAE
ncbi:hypothetical protein [Sporolactobacillus inulinus]|uniref:Uncharacterized protein n=2 Tax=Sporolactobacillus inulinus TaxID=2078 RepID=A0A4Y1Z8S6_9BACL|nr:hypothetical protein [Sporolactobacillus inulinus]KLI03342.1 hypothetical protein SINU_03260 [Sporolactobacillus inulinus CASD]GAY75406.1 hypothetical protein NBRC111894_960 [Sporolactobacillus inulinus]GEB78002.1 hypothetical protein SIN01_23470 [Sporolactobacillus inulinus]